MFHHCVWPHAFRIPSQQSLSRVQVEFVGAYEVLQRRNWRCAQDRIPLSHFNCLLLKSARDATTDGGDENFALKVPQRKTLRGSKEAQAPN